MPDGMLLTPGPMTPALAGTTPANILVNSMAATISDRNFPFFNFNMFNAFQSSFVQVFNLIWPVPTIQLDKDCVFNGVCQTRP